MSDEERPGIPEGATEVPMEVRKLSAVFSVRFSPEELALMRAEARRLDVKVGALIKTAVREFLADRRVERTPRTPSLDPHRTGHIIWGTKPGPANHGYISTPDGLDPVETDRMTA